MELLFFPDCFVNTMLPQTIYFFNYLFWNSILFLFQGVYYLISSLIYYLNYELQCLRDLDH